LPRSPWAGGGADEVGDTTTDPNGYVAFVEELPGANTQGATLDEARANLEEAVALVLDANRTLARQDTAGVDVIREPLKLTA
jgi:predicted RNase H-like HicB family nuclease